MRNRLITGLLFLVFGILIAFGPLSIFPVCGVVETRETTAQNAMSPNNKESPAMGDQSDMNSDGADAQSSMQKSSDMVMKCHWTARAMLGVGVLIALLGALLVVFKAAPVRLGLSLALGLNGILALLIPTVLIGVCGSAHMTCHSLTLPALTVLGGAAAVSAGVNAAYLSKNQSKKEKAT